MQSRSISTLLFFGLSALLAPPLLKAARAEFIQTSPGIYQHDALAVKAIATESGIFLIDGPKTDLQIFDPATVPIDGTAHAFLKFDTTRGRYDSLIIGDTGSYMVKGSFTIESGPVRFSVDNNGPYATIVVDDPENTAAGPSILGFLGTTMVINDRGQEMRALTEANQFKSKDMQRLIQSYTLKPAGLFFKSTKVATRSIGLDIEPPNQKKNPCLQSSVLYLDQSDLKRIRTGVDENQRVKDLEGILTDRKGWDPLKGVLILRAETESAIGLNYLKGGVVTIKPLGDRLGTSSKKTLCVVSDLSIGH